MWTGKKHLLWLMLESDFIVAQELALAFLYSYRLWPRIKSEFLSIQSNESKNGDLIMQILVMCSAILKNNDHKESAVSFTTYQMMSVHPRSGATLLILFRIRGGWCFSQHALQERPGNIPHWTMGVATTERERRDTCFCLFCISI